MADPRLDPASSAWGLALGATFGSWLRGTLDALFLPRDRAPDWRRSFSHENTNRPSGPPPLKLRRPEPEELFIRMDEGRIQRGNGNGGPSTEKPAIEPKGQRPPLGLKPRWIVDEQRLREVADAINRSRKAGWKVPVEWLDEYDELVRKVEAAGVFNAPAIRAAAVDEKPQFPPPSEP